MLSEYRAVVHEEFFNQLGKYKSLKKRIQKKVDHVLKNPYNSELLTKKKYDLRGKRSVRLTKNFRIVFAICEECIKRRFQDDYNLPDCKSLCKGYSNSVIFLTVGPHGNAYKEK